MSGDARFEDGAERPLRLRALDPDDLAVIAALAQDAAFPGREAVFDRKARRFAVLLNRFRWEDAAQARVAGRPFERVRSVLVIEDALSVQTRGIDPADGQAAHALLSLTMEPGEDGTGRVVLALQGGGAIAVEVEALEVVLRDVTRPYAAPTGKAPAHPED